eukprot:705939-Amphidinium_carterae.2
MGSCVSEITFFAFGDKATGDVVSIEQCAKDWCRVASSDAEEAAYFAVHSLFELASMGSVCDRLVIEKLPEDQQETKLSLKVPPVFPQFSPNTVLATLLLSSCLP